jgi:predicted ferric reductase
MILGARIKLVERLLGGLDHVYRVHRVLGSMVPLLLIGHALLVTSSKAVTSLPSALILFTPAAGWGVFLGVIALVGLMMALLFPRLRTLKHETFVVVHRSIGVMFLLGGLHVILVPVTWTLPPLLVSYLLVLMGAGALAFVYRSILGRFTVRRYRYQIEQVNRLGLSAVELVLTPLGAALTFQPGQFVFVAIVDDLLPREAHPFSLTSAASDTRLRLVVKALGDYMARLLDLRPGGVALLEGPYGGFSYIGVENQSQIWIAGGIGVTPFLSMARSLDSMARSLDGTPYEIDFYYCTQGAEDAFFLDELFEMSDRCPRFRVISIRRTSLGHITVEDIQAASISLLKHDFLICGPPVMIHNLRQQLLARGVPPSQIHFEDFASMSV